MGEHILAATLELGTRTGVPGGARALRPDIRLCTPMGEAERRYFSGILGVPRPAVRGASRRVALLVEDDPSVRKLMARLAAAAGFATVESGNGMQALGLLASHCPDLIVTDLRLPGVDGFRIIRAVRSHLCWDCPIFVVSGLEALEDEVTALDLGADYFLRKPFKSEQVRAHFEAAARVWERLRATGNP